MLFLRNRYKSRLSIYRPTGGYCSRRNGIGSNRANVTKSSVRRGFEYTFFALTLNPMGKWRCLEIEAYAAAGSRQNGNRTSRLLHSPSRGSVSAHIHCGPAIYHLLPRKQHERSLTFNGVSVFTYSNAFMETT